MRWTTRVLPALSVTVTVTSKRAASRYLCRTVKRPVRESFALRLRLPSPKRIDTLAMPDASVARPLTVVRFGRRTVLILEAVTVGFFLSPADGVGVTVAVGVAVGGGVGVPPPCAGSASAYA